MFHRCFAQELSPGIFHNGHHIANAAPYVDSTYLWWLMTLSIAISMWAALFSKVFSYSLDPLMNYSLSLRMFSFLSVPFLIIAFLSAYFAFHWTFIVVGFFSSTLISFNILLFFCCCFLPSHPPVIWMKEIFREIQTWRANIEKLPKMIMEKTKERTHYFWCLNNK